MNSRAAPSPSGCNWWCRSGCRRRRVKFSPASPSRIACSTGVPPATHASIPKPTWCARLRSTNSTPYSATSCLLAVTKCLPASSAAKAMARAVGRTPTNSTMMSTSGSRMTFFQSEVILTGWPNQERSRLCTLREQMTLSWRSHPSRRWISSWCSARTFSVPVPTVPNPITPRPRERCWGNGFGETNSR